MSEPVASQRCDYCGCLVTLREFVRHTENLATPEQRAAIRTEIGTDGDWRAFQARLARYGTRTLWVLPYRCPGCGSLGTDYSHSYATREEAEAVAAAQNQLATTPAAQAEATQWEEEVARRAEHDARAFAALFAVRFPHLSVSRPEPGAWRFPDLEETGYHLIMRLLSEHPSVKEPLTIHVKSGEVLISWVHGWHEHVFREGGAELADVEHLHRALDVIERLVSEQVSVVALYRGEQLVGGGGVRPGTDPPQEYLRQLGPGGGDRFVIVSWRGTDDREICRKSPV